MQPYSEHKPTAFDTHLPIRTQTQVTCQECLGYGRIGCGPEHRDPCETCNGRGTVDDPTESRDAWLTLDVTRTRDSGPLAESNFASALAMLGGESSDVEIHRFGHWGPGWYEIILVRPGTDAARIGEEIEASLADYPILDEDDHSEREHAAASETWRACYSDRGRLEYIRDHRREFEFHDWLDLLACVRGKYFAGYASELVEDNGT